MLTMISSGDPIAFAVKCFLSFFFLFLLFGFFCFNQKTKTTKTMPSPPTLLSLLLLLSLTTSIQTTQPNPPQWPPSVSIFDPNDPTTTQTTIDNAFAQNGGNSPPNNGQFSSSRFAFLFLPGYHNVVVNVGYYTHVMGLGAAPQDVNIREVSCQNGDYDYNVGALDNFWRLGENFMTKPSAYFNGEGTPVMVWAVSQASPLRRVYVNGNIDLFQYNFGCCAGYASGGYMSNSFVSGTVNSGSQQQWVNRNNHFEAWKGGGWNMVFVGCDGDIPADNCPSGPEVAVETTPVVAEKPFIVIGDDGRYSLAVPPVEMNKVGNSDFSQGLLGHRMIAFEDVYVAVPGDSVDVINQYLDQGIHIVFSPGLYNLTDTITINKPDMVVLGIGFPTLTPTTGKPILQIGDVAGVRVAGLLYEAGFTNVDSLVVVGDGGVGDSSDPIVLSDVFARVGGPNDQNVEQVSANKMIHIKGANVVLDNTWFWRADHSVSGLVSNGDNPCLTGVVVDADNVTAYGLAVEHTLNDMVQWNGENGQVFFYQSEFPYDVNQSYATNNYVSYRVNVNVNSHSATGVGAYSYFRDYPVYVKSGFSSLNNSPNVKFNQAISVFLNGQGGIEHVINDVGGSVSGEFGVVQVCSYP